MHNCDYGLLVQVVRRALAHDPSASTAARCSERRWREHLKTTTDTPTPSKEKHRRDNRYTSNTAPRAQPFHPDVTAWDLPHSNRSAWGNRIPTPTQSPFTLPMLALYNTSIPCPACLLPLLTFNVLPRWPRPSLLLTVFPSARPDFTCCPFFSGVDPSERHEHAPRRSICDVIGGALVRTPTWASKMPAATRPKTKS